MQITIGSEWFTHKELSFEEYLLLYLLVNNYHSYADLLLNKKSIGLNRLKELGYIENSSDDSVILTTIAESIFTNDTEIMFEELKKEYPKETPSGRKLHGNLVGCKIHYTKKIENDKALHEFIIKAVKTEKIKRAISNQLDYFDSLVNYILKENWEVYREDVENPVSTKAVIQPGLNIFNGRAKNNI